jgi:hypothetical protein
MKIETLASAQQQSPPAKAARGGKAFAVGLAVVLLLACTLMRPKHWGDIMEYTLLTVAVANHGTPDIRLADVAEARVLLPDLAGAYDAVADGLRKGVEVPQPGLLRGTDGRMYALHFFGYPALAAVPFKLLQFAGRSPFRAYLAVNAAFVFALGLALFRLYGSSLRASLGLLTYFLCGGLLYWQWSSPESMSATALLAGLIFYVTGMPIAGGVLAGFGAMQNPPIVFFCAFAPLLRLAAAWPAEKPTLARQWALFGWRYVAGALACAAMFGLNVLFNEAKFGTPSIIAKVATSTDLITLNRLHSFFFDLNQGMVMAIPAVALALLAWPGRQRRVLAVAAAACAFSVAMAVPSLVAQNWNSGASAIMRYVLWAAMPLLFAFLWQLRSATRWPAILLTLVLVLQAGTMAHALRYYYMTFSPLAQRVLAFQPGWYNPDPEIFFERADQAESFPMPEKTYAYKIDGQVVKTLYNVQNPRANEQLCGPGRVLSPDNRYADADFGWRYINGPVTCTAPR